MSIRVEVLTSAHDRSTFTCGIDALDDWFRKRASQDQRRHVAQVFVALDGTRILGFYSLSMFSVSLDGLPAAHAKKLPRYEAIPAALIGRLARSLDARDQRIGELLLVDALQRVVRAAGDVAAWAIVVDAKDERGRRFYEQFGFMALPSRPMRLFLPAATAAAALARR